MEWLAPVHCLRQKPQDSQLLIIADQRCPCEPRGRSSQNASAEADGGECLWTHAGAFGSKHQGQLRSCGQDSSRAQGTWKTVPILTRTLRRYEDCIDVQRC